MTTLSQIEHIVVLMLENRSFDCLLGRLYTDRPDFNGLTGLESNPQTGGSAEPIRVWNSQSTIPGTMTIPSPDPGESFLGITTQLFGFGASASDASPPMSGFVDDYTRQTKEPPYDPKQVMHFFRPEQVPIISALAKSFAVCDQWHACAPNQTWPNRFFAHCATGCGYLNNSPPHFPYMMPSIFERLNARDDGWRVYYHDIPQSLTLARLWDHIDRFRHFNEFARDAAAGHLPAYAFLEPRYFPDAALGMPNDQHPPHDVVFGEQLIATVYNAVRASPLWESTLLIITYDEHGGCFDHAPPPLAVAPGDGRTQEGFTFNRYGVRVPAIIVSPYIAPGTILRAASTGVPHAGPPYPFDHTSIIATVRKCFGLDGALTARDAAAPDLGPVLKLDRPTNDALSLLTVPSYTPSAQDLTAAIGRPLTDMQQNLHRLASILPTADADFDQHIEQVKSGVVAPAAPPGVVAEARRFIAGKIAALFG
ncbi:MAG TPA: alkaline phosphatase family protein [Steroidobacteraceae bacterium]|jgi:phospholipase C|nr:alkaline phosphatase family protein [Steroidobacteraceae bacterium]